MEKTFHFLSGLPRSGSTVLTAILNQHPEVYATPTSPLLDILISNQKIWHETQQVRANPIGEQLTNITRRLIDAVWKHRPEPIIIDKNRGWGKNMPASVILFEREIKIVMTVRDLPSIMASWLKLLKSNPGNHIDQSIISNGLQITDENRTMEMWNNMVRDCYESVSQAVKDAGNRILIIEYDDLMESPKSTLSSIEDFLKLTKYEYDFNNIINNTNDDDLSAWGLDGMHTIRSTLKKISESPQTILGDDLFEKFKDIERSYRGQYGW
jgi:sulfotransferase